MHNREESKDIGNDFLRGISAILLGPFGTFAANVLIKSDYIDTATPSCDPLAEEGVTD